MDADQFFPAAMHTSSDFPTLVSSTSNRTLMGAAQSPIKITLARQATMTYLQPATRPKLSDVGFLERVTESDEFKSTTRGEAAASYALDTRSAKAATGKFAILLMFLSRPNGLNSPGWFWDRFMRLELGDDDARPHWRLPYADPGWLQFRLQPIRREDAAAVVDIDPKLSTESCVGTNGQDVLMVRRPYQINHHSDAKKLSRSFVDCHARSEPFSFEIAGSQHQRLKSRQKAVSHHM